MHEEFDVRPGALGEWTSVNSKYVSVKYYFLVDMLLNQLGKLAIDVDIDYF